MIEQASLVLFGFLCGGLVGALAAVLVRAIEGQK